MRPSNPLREILDSTLLREEPLLDTEWPAQDLEIELPEPAVERRFAERTLKGYEFSRP